MLNLPDDRLNTQIKAIQTLVSEIDLPRLLEKMMSLVIETTGAEKGVLLLPNQDHWYIEAEGRADQAEVRLLPAIPLETVEDRSETPLMSKAVVNYAIQTQQSLVLNDAVNEIQFARDPYIVRQQPKSVLCMPLLNQGRLTGLLYLENNLTTGAFTAERLERLKLLSSPAAISIENARLYAELKSSERQKAPEAAAAANQTTSAFLANISHELRTRLNAIIGFSRLAMHNPHNPADTQEQLMIITRSGEHLLSLINQVLDLAKFEAGHSPLNHTSFDPHVTLAERQTQVGGLAPGQPRYRLLIVDDDPTNRQLLRQMLTRNGQLELHFELQEAQNGQQAIEIWETFAPHLIWMDLRMPVIDGYEATKMIKAKQAASHNLTSKIIALTASSYEEKRAEILDIGYDDFLRKPFRKADIFALLERHLGVQFVYAPPSEHAADSTSTSHRATTAVGLAAIPSPLRTQLEKAALSGNMDEIEAMIDQIKAHQPTLAAQFEQLADAFDYMQIVTILQGVEDE